MTPPTVWPDGVRRFIRDLGGARGEGERLGGMGGGEVYRIRAVGGTVIVKGGARPAEAAFYRAIAPEAAREGIAVPALLYLEGAGTTFWLILEDIPRPLPRERRLADPELLAILGRLHGSATLPNLLPPGGFRPSWTAETTAGALACLPPAAAAQLAGSVAALREACQPLFAPRCAISGDPNPANWGLRHDGTLVLFDWERCCLGTPALDLAISVPGLGDRGAFRRVARQYPQGVAVPGPSASPTAATPERLARDIAVAKVWSVVEFLGHHHDGSITQPDIVAWLVARFPAWVRDIAAFVAT